MEPIRRSGIFRASISKNVVISVASVDMEPIIDSNYATVERNYNDTKDLAILTGDETVATFRAIKAIDASGKLGNVNIDLATVASYDVATRTKVLGSNLIGARISELALSAPYGQDYTTKTTAAGCFTAPNTVDAINIKTCDLVSSYVLLDQTQMETYFELF